MFRVNSYLKAGPKTTSSYFLIQINKIDDHNEQARQLLQAWYSKRYFKMPMATSVPRTDKRPKTGDSGAEINSPNNSNNNNTLSVKGMGNFDI